VKYAQIEKELLATTFACEKFHQFIYGRKVMAETDHKPLIGVMNKSIEDCPMRLQRLLLRLQKYDICLTYVAGKNLYIADTLSRNPLFVNEDVEDEIEAHVRLIMKAIAISETKLNEIRMESLKDDLIEKVKEAVINGWPNKTNQEFNFCVSFEYRCDSLYQVPCYLFNIKT